LERKPQQGFSREKICLTAADGGHRRLRPQVPTMDSFIKLSPELPSFDLPMLNVDDHHLAQIFRPTLQSLACDRDSSIFCDNRLVILDRPLPRQND
jgi:hypothetical protein